MTPLRTIKMSYFDETGADAPPIEIEFDPAKFAELPRMTDKQWIAGGLHHGAKRLPRSIGHRNENIVIPNGAETKVTFNYHFGACKDRPRTYFAWATLHWCNARHLHGVKFSLDVTSLPGETKGAMLVRLFDQFEDAVRAVWDANYRAGRSIHRVIDWGPKTVIDETTGEKVTISWRTVSGEIAA